MARALERFGELHEAFVETALNASNAPEGRRDLWWTALGAPLWQMRGQSGPSRRRWTLAQGGELSLRLGAGVAVKGRWKARQSSGHKKRDVPKGRFKRSNRSPPKKKFQPKGLVLKHANVLARLLGFRDHR